MSDPIIDSADLGTYLNDPEIDADRADFFITQAQILCESIVTPLPATAVVVVTRVAGRAYTSVTSPRQRQLDAAGNPYGGSGGMGGVYLDGEDETDLRRLNGGGGAFSIDMLPADYTAPASWGTTVDGWAGS